MVDDDDYCSTHTESRTSSNEMSVCFEHICYWWSILNVFIRNLIDILYVHTLEFDCTYIHYIHVTGNSINNKKKTIAISESDVPMRDQRFHSRLELLKSQNCEIVTPFCEQSRIFDDTHSVILVLRKYVCFRWIQRITYMYIIYSIHGGLWRMWNELWIDSRKMKKIL